MRTHLWIYPILLIAIGCESESESSEMNVVLAADAQGPDADGGDAAPENMDTGEQNTLDAGEPDSEDSMVSATEDAAQLPDMEFLADRGQMDTDAMTPVEALTPIEIDVTPADEHYLGMWMERDRDFVSSLKWLPHFIYEQGYTSICIRLEMRSPRQFSAEDIEEIRQLIEEGVHEWQKGLVGHENWPNIPLAPVRLFGVAHTQAVELLDELNVPVYVNAEAKCPDECSRFHRRAESEPDYSDCPRQDLDHFDFTSWYSDFDFGAAGHGGDWGTRLAWDVFQNELRSRQRRVSYHEIGHVAGLPDMYTYPFRDSDHRRPRAIMATSEHIEDFDYLLIRMLWDLGWAAFYADE